MLIERNRSRIRDNIGSFGLLQMTSEGRYPSSPVTKPIVDYSDDIYMLSYDEITDMVGDPDMSNFHWSPIAPFYQYYNGSPWFKDVENYKQTCFLIPSEPWTYSKSVLKTLTTFSSDGTPPYDSGYAIWASPNTALSGLVTDVIRKADYVPSYESILDAGRELFSDRKFLGVAGIDLLTFLAELRDVTRIADVVKFHKIDQFEVSDKYLGVNFGVLPFIGDMKNIYDTWKNFNPALKKWNQLSDKAETLNCHSTFDTFETEGTFEHTYGANSKYGFISNSYKTVSRYTQKSTCKLHLYFTPKHFSSSDTDRLKRSVLGFSKPLTALWNAIPYSFAVDWIFNVGNIIEDFEYSKPALNVDVESCGYSVTTQTRVETDVIMTVDGIDFPCGTIVHIYDTYRRVPLNPHMFDNLSGIGDFEFTSSVSGYKLSLASALLTQKLR